MPKVEYPAYFENGVIGVRVTQDIGYREPYIYVPYKMVITQKKIMKNAVLRPIIDAFPDVFGSGENTADTIIMCIGLYYEIS